MAKKTDLILLQCEISREQAEALLQRFNPDDIAKRITVVFSAWSQAEHNAQAGLLYVYLKLDKTREIGKKDIRKIQRKWIKICESDQASASRLRKVFEIAGAASKSLPSYHYVVETTPEKGWFKEISAWYDQEHMPGLASVPGCIHAVRMINLDDGPRSFACYDLVGQDVMGSEPWLKVRATDWSSKCRPHFTNTKRNMFEVLQR